MTMPDDIHPIDAFAVDGIEVVRCSYCSALVIQDSEDADWNGHVQSHRDVADMLAALRNGKADA